MPEITEGNILWLTGGLASVSRRSIFTGKLHTMTMKLTPEQYAQWKLGVLIQDALPHLTVQERELAGGAV